ncbi:MAG: NUDIX domain-containing protein [Candidatus Paceibacterota bacterium]
MMVPNHKIIREKTPGHVPRVERREISSGVIIYRRVNNEARFLVLYHGRNQWEIPRGKIEAEERSFVAALRETREETGFTRADLRFADHFKAYENWTFLKNGQKVFKTIIYYLAETSKKHPRIEPSFEGYGWFTYREALQIFVGPKNNENRKVLKQAHDFLGAKNKAPSRVHQTSSVTHTPRVTHTPQKHTEGA